MRIYFDNKKEFSKYMNKEKPTEVWLDTFSIEEPYMLFEYDGFDFRGKWNHQALFSGHVSDFTWLFDSKDLYIKL